MTTIRTDTTICTDNASRTWQELGAVIFNRLPGCKKHRFHRHQGSDLEELIPGNKLGDQILYDTLNHIKTFEEEEIKPDGLGQLIGPLLFTQLLNLRKSEFLHKVAKIVKKNWPKNFFEKNCPLFIVWNQNENHWVLIELTSDLQKIKIYDSFNRRQDKSQVKKILKVIRSVIRVAQRVLKFVGPLPLTKASHRNVQIPRQDNTIDCGVFVVAYFYCRLTKKEFNFSQKDINNIRLGALMSLISDTRFMLLDWVQFTKTNENKICENGPPKKKQRLV